MANINSELVPVLANDALFSELLTLEQSLTLNTLLSELPVLPIDALESEPGFEPLNGDEP
jgi:hypothetical protein